MAPRTALTLPSQHRPLAAHAQRPPQAMTTRRSVTGAAEAAAQAAANPSLSPAAAAAPPAAFQSLPDELPAARQRQQELEALPVAKDDRLQVGSRVSCQARCFDSDHGTQWSRSTFGEGGTSIRIYGTVAELLADGNRGRQSTFRVRWDLANLPHHDESRAANQHSVGQRSFTKAQLRREEPTAGRRATMDESSPSDELTSGAPVPVLQRQAGPEAAADDSPMPDSGTGIFVDEQLTDDEDDEEYNPDDDSGESSEDDAEPDPEKDVALSRDDLLVTLPVKDYTLDPFHGHPVVWHYGGQGDEYLEGASLPWHLGGAGAGPTAWGPRADPDRDHSLFNQRTLTAITTTCGMSRSTMIGSSGGFHISWRRSRSSSAPMDRWSNARSAPPLPRRRLPLR